MCNTVAYGRYSNNSWFQVNQLTGLSVSAVVAKEFLFGCTFWASTIKFYAKASLSQHYQFEFLTLPSPVQHPKKFLFTIL